MLNLNKIMNETLTKIEEEKFIEGVMEKHVKSAIDETIGDLFRWSGPMKKQLKEEVESKLKLDLSNLDLASYSQIMVNAVHQELDSQIQTSCIEKLKEGTKDLLKHSKDSYTLSEIIEKLKPEEPEEEGHISLHIDDRRNLVFIRFDVEGDKWESRCDYSLTLHKDGKIHSMEFEEKDPLKGFKLGNYYGVEKLLIGAYLNGAKIELDEGTNPDDYDTSYGDDY